MKTKGKLGHSFFSNALLAWNRDINRREMPWKGEKDPYRIWLSEVILQQTRVEQGWEYYERFVSRFPAITDLAAAKDDEVFKLWEGLGYYSRCRNLLHTARVIAFEQKGVFPSNYSGISSLKGIGPYISAAIASFAFGLPYAVVDGNVIRVLSRVFGIDRPVDSTATRKEINALAEELLDKEEPGVYNQALMDLGATICKPRAPLCAACPMAGNCIAFRTGRTEELPFKAKKLIKKKRFFHYIIFEHNNLVYLRKRVGKDIWKDLFEFHLLERDQLMTPEMVLGSREFLDMAGKDFDVVDVSPVQKQQLTHQELSGIFFHVRVKARPKGLEDYVEVDREGLSRLALPRFILSYLHEKNVNLIIR
jgi:A/G-specific adenine glycosylase